MDNEFQVVKLHEFPDLMDQAAHLLNSEWPRSYTARCHSFKKSSDDLPCSLLLIKSSACNVPEVVGYSCLSKVLQLTKSVIIESVVVDKKLRGCGLGRKLVEVTEDFARNFGYETIHLSTHDKCLFYKHLGYSMSSPVSPEKEVTKYFSSTQIQKICNQQIIQENTSSNNTIGQINVAGNNDQVLPIEPELPLQPPLKTLESLSQLPLQLPSMPQLVPPPPPPPPPMPPSPNSLLPLSTNPPQATPSESSMETASDRIGKLGRVVWMKKDL